MIPETAGAILGLLLVIGPGLVFEFIREHYRPAPERSTFREASTVALASLTFTLAAVAILAIARAIFPEALPDPRLWLLDGRRYVANHFTVVVSSVGALIAVSASLAALTARLMFGGEDSGHIKSGVTGWFELFRASVPKGKRPMLRVRLHDGTEFIGLVVHYSANILPAEREIALGPPLQRKDPEADTFELLPDDGAWERVVIPATSIDSFWVRYAPKDRP